MHMFAGHSDGPRCPYYILQVVLDEFSLTIPAGKVTALCGLSGAGQLGSSGSSVCTGFVCLFVPYTNWRRCEVRCETFQDR